VSVHSIPRPPLSGECPASFWSSVPEELPQATAKPAIAEIDRKLPIPSRGFGRERDVLDERRSLAENSSTRIPMLTRPFRKHLLDRLKKDARLAGELGLALLMTAGVIHCGGDLATEDGGADSPGTADDAAPETQPVPEAICCPEAPAYPDAARDGAQDAGIDVRIVVEAAVDASVDGSIRLDAGFDGSVVVEAATDAETDRYIPIPEAPAPP
jgi:hypothetical protein